MDKRYQVFVSSTYVDLIPERSEVMQALLELKCMPAGMELFPAASETQWNWIKKVIDESDYYIVLVAGRYGTISRESGQSYTEMEYRYAIDTGKPVIGFLHEDIAKIQSKFVEQTAVARRKLDSFRDFVSGRLCKMYSSPSDLGAKVSRSITQLREQHPAVGWIRADLAPSSERIDEILRLKEENERLTEHIYRLGLQEPDTLNSLASGSEAFQIEFFFNRMEENTETGRFCLADKHMDCIELSWDELFSAVGPSLIQADLDWSVLDSVIPLVESRAYPKLHRKWPRAKFQKFQVSSADADAILLQLRALKLIAIAKNERWSLTPYGDNYMAKLLAVPKGRTKRD